MSVRGFTNWRAYGTRTKETAYGDGLSVIDSTWNMDPNMTAEETNVFVNGEEVTGFEEPSETDVLSHNTNHTHAQRATAHAVAFFGKAAWGISSMTEVSSLAAGRVYRHDIFHTDSPGILPSFGWVENRGGLIRAYPGGVVNRFAISMERNQHVRLEAEVTGSGTFTAVSTVRPALLTAEPYLRVANAKVWIGTGAAQNSLTQSNTVSNIASGTTALDCVLRQLSYELVNNLLADDGYGFNTNGIRCQLERGARAQSLAAQIEFDGTATDLARVKSQTDLALEVDVVSGTEVVTGSGFYYGFNLLFPLIRYTAANLTGGRDKLILEVTPQILQQGTANRNQRSAMLAVWNAQSAYLL